MPIAHTKNESIMSGVSIEKICFVSNNGLSNFLLKNCFIFLVCPRLSFSLFS